MSHAVALQPIIYGRTQLANARGIPKLFTPINSEPAPLYKPLKEEQISDSLNQFITEIDLLVSWSKNWDGNNAAKPRINSIKNAKLWGKQIYTLAVKNEYEWRKPFISADEEGNVVLEWWYKDRNLTLDISANEVFFSETRNADSSPKITTGILTHSSIASKLKWLILGG